MHKLFRAKTLSFQKPRKNFELALYPDYNAPAGHPGCWLLGFSSSTWHKCLLTDQKVVDHFGLGQKLLILNCHI